MALINTEIDFAVPTGYSCAGIVIECGSGITGFKAGDRVACAGAGKANHSEVVSIPQNLAVHVPQGCDLESAASATLGAIAIQGIRRADVRFGEFVAVVGLGLIGQLTIQLLKVAGCRTIGIDINSARVETARTLGAERPTALQGSTRRNTGPAFRRHFSVRVGPHPHALTRLRRDGLRPCRRRCAPAALASSRPASSPPAPARSSGRAGRRSTRSRAAPSAPAAGTGASRTAQVCPAGWPAR